MQLQKILATLCTALAFFASTAQAQDNRIDTIRSDAPELARYGKHAVGVKTLNLIHPGQADILRFKAGAPMPVYDRPLTVEVWYPAAPGATVSGTVPQHTWTSWGPRCSKQRGSAS